MASFANLDQQLLRESFRILALQTIPFPNPDFSIPYASSLRASLDNAHCSEPCCATLSDDEEASTVSTFSRPPSPALNIPPLPAELIGHIVSFISDDIHALTATLATASQFRFFCEQALFTNIDFGQTSAPESMRRLLRICEQIPHVAELVENLTTYLPVKAPGKAAFLEKLLSPAPRRASGTRALPNLRTLHVAPNERERKMAVDFQAVHPGLARALCDVIADGALERVRVDGLKCMPPAFIVLMLSSVREVVLGNNLSLEWKEAQDTQTALEEFGVPDLGTTLERLVLPKSYTTMLIQDRLVGPSLVEFLGHLVQGGCFASLKRLQLNISDQTGSSNDWCKTVFAPLLPSIAELELNYGSRLSAPPLPESCSQLTTLELAFEQYESRALPTALTEIISDLPNLAPRLETLRATLRTRASLPRRDSAPSWSSAKASSVPISAGVPSLTRVVIRLEQQIAFSEPQSGHAWQRVELSLEAVALRDAERKREFAAFVSFVKTSLKELERVVVVVDGDLPARKPCPLHKGFSHGFGHGRLLEDWDAISI
ncbi:hypothetical protein MKEN_00144900 [Mycena kentingensis (nom. inval.)]|nr:hypothetical protein MKEN_00144900 [Mycena kentingensis (nom. inval.)]